MRTGVKLYGLIALLNIIQGCTGEQPPQQPGPSLQKPPADTLKTDSPHQPMPILKPDTAKQEKMPVVPPPANVQPK